MTNKKSNKNFSTIKELEEFIRVEAQTVYQSYDPEKIKKMTGNYIEEGISDFIYKSLGFSSRWGGTWEVDHCNGRTSVLTALISENAREKATELISEYIKDLALTKQQIDAIKKEYKNELMSELKNIVREKAREDLRRYLEDLAIGDVLEGNTELVRLKNKIIDTDYDE